MGLMKHLSVLSGRNLRAGRRSALARRSSGRPPRERKTSCRCGQAGEATGGGGARTSRHREMDEASRGPRRGQEVGGAAARRRVGCCQRGPDGGRSSVAPPRERLQVALGVTAGGQISTAAAGGPARKLPPSFVHTFAPSPATAVVGASRKYRHRTYYGEEGGYCGGVGGTGHDAGREGLGMEEVARGGAWSRRRRWPSVPLLAAGSRLRRRGREEVGWLHPARGAWQCG